MNAITTATAVLGIWTAAAIPAGIATGHLIQGNNSEDYMPDQPTPRLAAPVFGRPFVLQRDTDISGVSGTGTVADGVEFPDGSVAVRWRGRRASTVIWGSLDDARQIHGHAGATRIVWAGDPSPTAAVLAEVAAERVAQDTKWGEQNHRDGTGPEQEILPAWPASDLANAARNSCQRHAEMGIVSWLDVLGEEVAEALAEDDPARLRAELIQVAAVAVAWAEAIDRRTPAGE